MITCLSFLEATMPTNVEAKVTTTYKIHDKIEIITILKCKVHVH